jgi:hypothetical protein
VDLNAGQPDLEVDEDQAKKNNAEVKHDAVFVLGDGSVHNDTELLLAVHSMRKYCGFVNRIFIVGSSPKCNLSKYDVVHIPCNDPYKENKDGNMMFKALHAIKTVPDLSDDFLLCSDDQLVTKPCTWDDFRPKYIKRFVKEDAQFDAFSKMHEGTWGKRLFDTLVKASQGGKKAYFYEPHIWSQTNKRAFADMCSSLGGLRNAGVIKSQYFNFINACDYHEPISDFTFFSSPMVDWDGVFEEPTRFISYNEQAFSSSEFRSKLTMLVK